VQRGAVAVDGRAHDASRNASVTGPDGRAEAQKADGGRWRPAAIALPPGQPVGGKRVRGRRRIDRPDRPVRATVRPPVRGVLAGATRVPSCCGRCVRRVRLRRPPEGSQPTAGQLVVRPVVVHV